MENIGALLLRTSETIFMQMVSDLYQSLRADAIQPKKIST